jgi:1-acyl-sn-glycerol-3-phosphate acyltransferase
MNLGHDMSLDLLMIIVKELVVELHPSWPSTRQVLPDSSLASNLGLDSLARVELFSRIDKKFGVILPEKIFAEAETSRDLWIAILAAEPSLPSVSDTERLEIKMDDTDNVPHNAKTLNEVLQWHMNVHPDRPHILFYTDEDHDEMMTYRQMDEGARRIAASLQDRGLLPGDPVSIMLPTCQDYFFTFFGILLSGGIPVPIYPPFRMNQLEDHLTRHSTILNNCKAKMMITIPEAKRFGRILMARVESMTGLFTVTELMDIKANYHPFHPNENDLAFLQYTSGSTGNPKGVMLSHANLLANIRALGEAVKIVSTDVIVSWLPLYHDMGLIGTCLTSLYFSVLLVVMSPLSFISRPQRWLRAIHCYQGTLSAAPNFAYELCLKKISDNDLRGLDLSSWRVACNGAEPISPNTVENFCRRFEPYGFRREAFMPVYGLAECSVGLTFPPLGRPPLVDKISREVFLSTSHAVPSSVENEKVLEFVACGHPLAGHEVRIVDNKGRELPERYEGNLEFRGPSATAGYFHNEEETRRLFNNEWLNSGDLAYVAEGDIYITGRKKDMIIRAGRNIYPQELEEAVSMIPGIRKGNVVVFAAEDKNHRTEKLVIVAETKEINPEKRDLLQREINTLAMDLTETAADEVVLAPPGSILKTSSGKIRRAGNRALYENGNYGRGQMAAWLQLLHIAISGVLSEIIRFHHGFLNILYSIYCWFLYGMMFPIASLWVIILPDSEKRWSGMREMVKFLARATFTPLTVEGTEHLTGLSSCIFVANHASYLDGYVMVASLPCQFRFVAKTELRSHLFKRVILEHLQTEFVERFDRQKSVEDAHRIASRAKMGIRLFFFAEGTFTRVPGIRSFHMGAFEAAVAAGVPVIPIAIRGTRSMLRDVSKFVRRGAITVIIGKPIDPHLQNNPDSPDVWLTAIKMRDMARNHILKHCGEPDISFR